MTLTKRGNLARLVMPRLLILFSRKAEDVPNGYPSKLLNFSFFLVLYAQHAWRRAKLYCVAVEAILGN